MKIFLLSVLALLAYWAIGRLGLWLHRKNADDFLGCFFDCEERQKLRQNISALLGPMWFVQSEDSLIRKMQELSLSPEEKLAIVGEYRSIKNHGAGGRDPAPRYPTWVIVASAVVSILVLILGFVRG